MKQLAIIKDGVVINKIVIDDAWTAGAKGQWSVPENCTYVEHDGVHIGDAYDGVKFEREAVIGDETGVQTVQVIDIDNPPTTKLLPEIVEAALELRESPEHKLSRLGITIEELKALLAK